MCVVIIINKGEKEIGTPDQFREHFGFNAETYEANDEIIGDCCLCQVDIEKTFKQHNIEYKADVDEYYVGMLDKVVTNDYINFYKK